MNPARFAVAVIALAGIASAAWTPSRAVAAGKALGSPDGNADASRTCLDFWELGHGQDEGRALKTAPQGGRRASEHVLVVNTKSGPWRFVDEELHRCPPGRFHWSYCGYVPALKAHLIGLDIEDLSSGKLLIDNSGLLLDAGAAVYPSKNRQLFLASSRVASEKLDRWTISDLSGKQLWTGQSGVIEDGGVSATYDEPKWIGNDTLRVTATCAFPEGRKGRATLVHKGDEWRWKSALHCE